ncbi:glycosyltransferase family protein [Leucobacter tenebrionis]|uniref:hypothetical protein n=1 Tax=Leucobacter tenebrionis TaxID=2873270 RepID=UPI001CA60BE7|nr:hypothetical protein [Leucobacter tenebrionis]QZY53147.1 hypothetical protein KVY00_06910 [Leucobacter tenebrionis]
MKWNFAWQRHHSLARAAAEAGTAVVFVEPHLRSVRQILARLARIARRGGGAPPTQQVPGGVRILPWSPIDLLPGATLRRIRRRLGAVGSLGAAGTAGAFGSTGRFGSTSRPRSADAPDAPDPENLMVLQYVPSRRSLALARQLRPRLLVYDRVLDWSRVPADWYPPRHWQRVEAALEREARLSTDSAAMQREWQNRGLDSLLILPAADDEFVRHEWAPPRSGAPIGYFGTVQEGIIDLPAIAEIAREHAVEIVGEVDEASRAALLEAGARLAPPVPVAELPAIIDRWSAILLPYRVGDRKDTLVPAKIWNALASRRPVLTLGLSLPEQIARHTVPLDGAASIAAAADTAIETAEPAPRSIPTWADAWQRLVGFASGSPRHPEPSR